MIPRNSTVSRFSNSLLNGIIQKRKQDPEPHKALVFALHGTTGIGKTFLTRLLVQHLFRKGDKSSYVRRYWQSVHFSDPRPVHEYQAKLRRELKETLRNCGRALFIFDEIEKMPPGVLDALRAWIDYDAMIDGIDARRAVFVLLSNAAGPEINAYMLQHWRDGKRREEADAAALHDIIEDQTFNSEGGLLHSHLIDHHVVDYFIPFLPLERRHVELCVRDELKNRDCLAKYDETQLKKILKLVADKFVYTPDDAQLYSKTGCKLTDAKLNLLRRENPGLVTCY